MNLNAGIGHTITNSFTQAGDANILAKKTELLGGKNKDVEAAAKEFEAVFLTQMIQHMFSGVKTNEVFGGGEAEETFKVLLFDEYGKAISKAGGVGVAEQVKRELLKMQEVAQ